MHKISPLEKANNPPAKRNRRTVLFQQRQSVQQYRIRHDLTDIPDPSIAERTAINLAYFLFSISAKADLKSFSISIIFYDGLVTSEIASLISSAIFTISSFGRFSFGRAKLISSTSFKGIK